ncbi:hypothetical protein F0L17_14605 [Streptomyces sp. TRM43335]|uniref:Uncharacterized protein n=1 Tax=Streptomyces taklimakanensis TaxID=2569853 RepID=A0A6G2BDV9_9ACTN|nr:hypothetical protein [Streptomyces taklimakanensis]MTE20316.1 hypothetical protein [Streptomyces taklimakanensis]
MHLFEPGARVWIAQTADAELGAVDYVGEATVTATLPCVNCYNELRSAHDAASQRRLAPSEIAVVGAVCRHPLGFLALTDNDEPIPVIADYAGAVAIPIKPEPTGAT